jgi:hypothetical protein
MTTQILSTEITDLRPLTAAELELEWRNANAACNQAWLAQSKTTVDEGYTYEQAKAAQAQALAAEAVKNAAYTRWQNALMIERWLSSLPVDMPETDYEYTNEDGVWSL